MKHGASRVAAAIGVAYDEAHRAVDGFEIGFQRRSLSWDPETRAQQELRQAANRMVELAEELSRDQRLAPWCGRLIRRIELLSEPELIARIKRYRSRDGVNGAARRLGVDSGYFSRIANGKQPPTAKLLRALGYRRVIFYEPVVT